MVVNTGVSVVFVDDVSVGGVGVGGKEYVKPNWGLVKVLLKGAAVPLWLP